MPKWLLAVNRSAGRRSCDPSEIRDLIVGLGVDCDLEAPESASAMTTMLVEAAYAGVSHFALAGGDGTMNLAANALLTLDLDTRWTVDGGDTSDWHGLRPIAYFRAPPGC